MNPDSTIRDFEPNSTSKKDVESNSAIPDATQSNNTVSQESNYIPPLYNDEDDFLLKFLRSNSVADNTEQEQQELLPENITAEENYVESSDSSPHETEAVSQVNFPTVEKEGTLADNSVVNSTQSYSFASEEFLQESPVISDLQQNSPIVTDEVTLQKDAVTDTIQTDFFVTEEISQKTFVPDDTNLTSRNLKDEVISQENKAAYETPVDYKPEAKIISQPNTVSDDGIFDSPLPESEVNFVLQYLHPHPVQKNTSSDVELISPVVDVKEIKENLITEKSTTGNLNTDNSAIENSATETLITNNSAIENSTTETLATDNSTIEDSITEDSTTENSTTENSETKEEIKFNPLLDIDSEFPELPNTLNKNIQVQLRSEGERLLLILPTEAQAPSSEYSWSDIWQQLQLRLKGSDRLRVEGINVHLVAQDRLLDARQLQALAESLNSVQLQLKSVSSSRRQTAIAAVTSGYSVEQVQLTPTLTTEPKIAGTPLADSLYLQMTIRSGVEIRHPGTVIILGDVNPGGIVIAEGDILVWGRLRGVAHAGVGGNRECLIMALQMEPTQLRIADAVARAPEKNPTQFHAEVAYVTDDGIRIGRASDFSRTQPK
ncbi:MAG: septum site-determining protein MinC [Scytonematopsis contorta HA4267-MV1]|jgi:septum site-determining protein MinC|nr:septum site-determining protein MinC [Scytonematopsis contorta HA4267-MV1]